jgi:hypothetical protein
MRRLGCTKHMLCTSLNTRHAYMANTIGMLTPARGYKTQVVCTHTRYPLGVPSGIRTAFAGVRERAFLRGGTVVNAQTRVYKTQVGYVIQHTIHHTGHMKVTCCLVQNNGCVHLKQHQLQVWVCPAGVCSFTMWSNVREKKTPTTVLCVFIHHYRSCSRRFRCLSATYPFCDPGVGCGDGRTRGLGDFPGRAGV